MRLISENILKKSVNETYYQEQINWQVEKEFR